MKKLLSRLSEKVVFVALVCLVVTGGVISGMTSAYLDMPHKAQPLMVVGIVGSDKGTQQSDVIAVAFINSNTGRMAILRCPRNARLVLRNGERNNVSSLPKRELLTCLEWNLGTQINRHIYITEQATENFLKALGKRTTSARGVERAGKRVARALQKELKSLPRHPLTLLRLKKLWQQDIQTDISFQELVALCYTLRKFNSHDLRQIYFPGTYETNGFIVDREQLASQVNSLQHWLEGRPDD